MPSRRASGLGAVKTTPAGKTLRRTGVGNLLTRCQAVKDACVPRGVGRAQMPTTTPPDTIPWMIAVPPLTPIEQPPPPQKIPPVENWNGSNAWN